ncbi:arrestin domain-containing protein 4-like [Centruroides vittatus]|uniref:arrestin domain-containing protein 4-like n=1 Tax=Centruroides sculpturatus TaxID=218467 RepID=UPI000C6E406B|nr:arrestin domain-containing protein 4-like [Centruroides sculpturatus]
MKREARKLRKFLILLDNETLLYHPGSFVSGRVFVELDNDTAVTVLYFHVVGEGIVRLSGTGGTTHNDSENYIDFKIKLLEDKGNGNVILSPGVHSFPFKLGLPLGMPSTFLGKHGWVQYYCKASLKEPNGLIHTTQQVFIVMNPIDLNLEPALLMQPFLCEIEETFGIPCITSGPVTCRVRLDKGGYVPGESICIYASIENNSKVGIRKTRAILTETIQYIVKNKHVQSESRELASIEKGGIEAGTAEKWKNELLYVPPLPPTNLRGCHLIRIQYDVYFIISPKGFDSKLKLQLPIMIATHPLRNQDGTLKRKRGTQYPTTLPLFRPWLASGKTFK